jgi:hypothetical protein
LGIKAALLLIVPGQVGLEMNRIMTTKALMTPAPQNREVGAALLLSLKRKSPRQDAKVDSIPMAEAGRPLHRATREAF